MAKLIWDKVGARYFETGVDRGVLYPSDGNGVVWNGLVAVNEAPSGGEPRPYYQNGIKFEVSSMEEEFGGTIEAYTYPDEFAACDGTAEAMGLSIHQQPRSEFGLSYRTLIGNDVDGISHGYKIHVVYNAMAMPAQISNGSLSDDPEATTFAWQFSTRAGLHRNLSIGDIGGGTKRPTANLRERTRLISHISIDSRTTRPVILRFVEEALYGTSKTAPRLLSISELYGLFDLDHMALIIKPNTVTGFSPIIDLGSDRGDLIGSKNEGVYTAPPETSLKTTTVPGVNKLE